MGEENYIDPKLYKEYNVKWGLRDEDGRGVLTGLTRVAEIQSYNVTEGEHIIPTDGVLYYRGIDCRDIVTGSEHRGRFAFEEAAYLLLFGELPTETSCGISVCSWPLTGHCPPTFSGTSS